MPGRFYTALAVLLIVIMALSFLPVHGEAEIYDTVVRLHVLANSDSDEDQALKLKVRDAVLDVTSPLVADCHTRAEAAAALEGAFEDIHAAAESVIAAEGREDLSGTVTVTLDVEQYPERTYESCCFPAGKYLSLRVCIGEAAGKNWWCVLFPPLCLSAATASGPSGASPAVSAAAVSTSGAASKNAASQASVKSLSKSAAEDAFISVGLTKEQYGIITETEKTKYKVRFKLLELIRDWVG